MGVVRLLAALVAPFMPNFARKVRPRHTHTYTYTYTHTRVHNGTYVHTGVGMDAWLCQLRVAAHLHSEGWGKGVISLCVYVCVSQVLSQLKLPESALDLTDALVAGITHTHTHTHTHTTFIILHASSAASTHKSSPRLPAKPSVWVCLRLRSCDLSVTV